MESSSLQNQQRLGFEIEFNKLKSGFEKEEQRMQRQLEEKNQEIFRLKKSLESQEHRLTQAERSTKENQELNHQEKSELREARRELTLKESQIQSLQINIEHLTLNITETDKQNQILKKRLDQITAHYEDLIAQQEQKLKMLEERHFASKGEFETGFYKMQNELKAKDNKIKCLEIKSKNHEEMETKAFQEIESLKQELLLQTSSQNMRPSQLRDPQQELKD